MLKKHSGLRTPTIEFFTVFGILFPKFCWYLWEKNILVVEIFFENCGWRPRIHKILEITRTIYLKSELGFRNLQENREVVFCYQNCSDLLEKRCSSDREKLWKFKNLQKVWNQWKVRTIFGNRMFLNLFLKVLRSNELERLEFKLEKNIWI